MIRFNVSTLIKARVGTSLNFVVDTGPHKLTDLEVDYLRGSVRVTRVQTGMLVEGTVETQVKLECVRCLGTFDLPITFELEETFRLPGTSPKPDMPYGVTDEGWLDLAPLLREQTWVEMPMKPICDPLCKGLCPHCGADLNVETCECEAEEFDPRWASLRDLL